MESKTRDVLLWTGAASGLAALAYCVYRLATRTTDTVPAGMGRIEGSTKKNGMTLTHHRGSMTIDKRIAIMHDLVWQGVQDPEMRKLALSITQHCQARDGRCEAKAVYDWVRKNARYTGDVAPVKMGANGPLEAVDLYQTAKRTIEFRGGDCLPAGTLLLAEGHRFVPIEEVAPGTRIWGRDKWTTVGDVWYKGVLSVDAVFLNNGSSFKATGDHKVYVAECTKHTSLDSPCSCPVKEREVKRVHVKELRPGMVMVAPDRIDFGTDSPDPHRTLVEGMYIADGWLSHAASFDIAGRDGFPKEQQKRVVKEICDQLGIPTYWHRKFIRIKDGDWARRVSLMGHRAPQKHALSINLGEAAAAALLRGIMADSGKNTNGNGRTFTTTSRELMLQVRILHKMFGLTCSERFIVDHGGVGLNPIWRLGVRDTSASRAVKLLRVKAVERRVERLPVYDLSTEDHYVYLPEADVTVSNCDDQAVLNATLLSLNGITAKLRVTAPRKGKDAWAHIYALAGLPKTSPSSWVALDTTLPGEWFGKEVGFAQHRDFAA